MYDAEAAAEERRNAAPKPSNFDEMSAAWDDEEEFLLQVELYRIELAEQGIPWSGWDNRRRAGYDHLFAGL